MIIDINDISIYKIYAKKKKIVVFWHQTIIGLIILYWMLQYSVSYSRKKKE